MGVIHDKLTAFKYAVQSKSGVTGTLSFDKAAQAILNILLNNGKTISSVKIVTLATNNQLLGDVNNDYIVDNTDLELLLEHINDLEGIDTAAADLNGDGVVDNADILLFKSVLSKFDPEKEQIIGRLEITYDDDTTDAIFLPIDV